jgi:hypothetical protein
VTEFPSSSPGTPGLKPGINHVSAHGRGADPDPNAVYALGSSSGESARLQRQSDELASVNTVFIISPALMKSALSPGAGAHTGASLPACCWLPPAPRRPRCDAREDRDLTEWADRRQSSGSGLLPSALGNFLTIGSYGPSFMTTFDCASGLGRKVAGRPQDGGFVGYGGAPPRGLRRGAGLLPRLVGAGAAASGVPARTIIVAKCGIFLFISRESPT